MANIFVINAHWNNHGDEAAIRAMIDELITDNNISLQIRSAEVLNFNYEDIKIVKEYPRKRFIPEMLMLIMSKGKLVFSRDGKEFVDYINNCDLVVHAPGGPSIGDIYKKTELSYLLKFMLIDKLGKPYIFYAPSAGPFKSRLRNVFRRKIYRNAQRVIFRESLSKTYYDELIPDNDAIVTLDSAFQHKIDCSFYESLLNENEELKQFVADPNLVIGLTVTDLKWHPEYGKDSTLSDKIYNGTADIVSRLINKGYKLLFIPQLFGEQNDANYMRKFNKENCFVLSENYDCYFQQYIISKIHAVIGMRYHSNIFAAKMCTPFISISYEQKMSGFIKKINYEEYCIDIRDYSANRVLETFDLLEENYPQIRSHLIEINDQLYLESHRTTDITRELLRDMKVNL